MIYSVHQCHRWVKGGIESGLAYRAKIFRNLGLEARFIFTTMFPDTNIQYETECLGFLNTEVIWLYGFFTDCKISPVTYTLKQLEDSFGGEHFIYSREGAAARYIFPEKNRYYEVFLQDDAADYVRRVCMISNGCLIRQDYYTYCRIYSEYYIPLNGRAHLYLRRYFNEDGTMAYEELITDTGVLYRFADGRLIYSREELAGYMMSRLCLTEKDVVLLDGHFGMIEWEAFIDHASMARIGFMIHAEHCWGSDEEHILWSDACEYAFSHAEKIDFFLTNTEAQSHLLRKQLERYRGIQPVVAAIPVAGLDALRYPEKKRKRHSLISVGRLMPEKRMDMVIDAVALAHKKIEDLTLDIYGEGGEEAGLRERIARLDCGDYVHLCGFQNLDEIYQNYDAYVTASCGETFGVAFLEAAGSGLPIIGFDRPYGAQVFIDHGQNGYKIAGDTVRELTDAIVCLFTEADAELFRRNSYKKAMDYLTENIEKRWIKLLSESRERTKRGEMR